MGQSIAVNCACICADKKISATMILWLICIGGCPAPDVPVREMILLVVVAVTLGKGRAQNVAKAGTAV